MYIERIEIRGFKSFAEKTVIHLDKGITNIVGPNGSGKSNIMDSIRWVLGEQSTKDLRSDKMENIIFGGSSSRKASHLAEVTLTVNNNQKIISSAFDTIGITRRLFRNGNSQYLINGINCRLKDIHDLFLDSGFGNKTYNILEFKHVDAIIRNLDNTRKNLLEEASGIGKYRIRKKQTLERLNSTEQDLIRVQDTLIEIERNLKLLESQAKKLDQFTQIREKHKNISLSIGKYKLNAFNADTEGLNKKIEEAEDIRIKSTAEFDAQLAKIEKEKLDILDLEKKVNESLKDINQQERTILQLEKEKELISQKKKNLGDREVELKAQKVRLEFNRNEYSNSIKLLEIDLEKRKKEHQEKRVESNATNQIKNEKTIALETLFAQKKELENTEKNTRALLIEHERKKVIHSERRLNLQQLIENHKGKIEKIKQELIETRQSHATELDLTAQLKKQIQIIKVEGTRLSAEIEKESKKLANSKNDTEDLQRELSLKNKELRIIQSINENMEGFSETIKFIKKSNLPEQIPPLLSEVIDCDNEYRILFENALEEYLNYFIVENKSAAFQIIDSLKNHSKGKGYFFILDEFNQQVPDTSSIHPDSLLRHIRYESKYLPLLYRLLSHVHVSQNNELQNTSVSENTVLISHDGNISIQNGIVQGGSAKTTEGSKIGRNADIERIQDEIKELDKKLILCKEKQEEGELKIKSLSAEKEASVNSEKLEQELRNTEDKILRFKINEEQLNTNLKELEVSIAENTKLFNEALSNMQDADPEELNLQKRIALTIEELQKLNENIKVKESELSDISRKANDININLIQEESKIESLEREHKMISKNLEEVIVSMEAIDKNLSGLSKEQETIKDAIEYEDEIEKKSETLQNKRKETEELEQFFFKRRGEINAAEKDLEVIRKNKSIQEMTIQELVNQKTQIETQKTVLLGALKSDLDLTKDEELEGKMADIHLSPNESLEGLEKKAISLKSNIESFGSVNPMAKEAFAEIKERYDFIKNQKSDLENAKISLKETIRETDTTAQQKLIETFDEIRNNFTSMFKQLFKSNDVADLVLTDTENPLDSDLEIIAQPRGKKTQTINQLSGGEKTMTAIAFLFSLYMHKPTPFCILDEIDAPLDDFNLDKYIKLIRHFSEKTQFIMITHNKRTISEADVIHGITMIENGVSQVIPINLNEVQTDW